MVSASMSVSAMRSAVVVRGVGIVPVPNDDFFGLMVLAADMRVV